MIVWVKALSWSGLAIICFVTIDFSLRILLHARIFVTVIKSVFWWCLRYCSLTIPHLGRALKDISFISRHFLVRHSNAVEYRMKKWWFLFHEKSQRALDRMRSCSLHYIPHFKPPLSRKHISFACLLLQYMASSLMGNLPFYFKVKMHLFFDSLGCIFPGRGKPCFQKK